MSDLNLLDISLRLMCLGQLFFFIVFMSVRLLRDRIWRIEQLALFLLLICCVCAVIFTGQYRPSWILHLRPVLLVFTDGLPFVFWLYALFVLTEVKHPLKFSKVQFLVVGICLTLHTYIFIILEGKGPLHDVVHVVAVIAVCHVVYLCLSEWRDDLVDARRRIRAVLLIAASAVLSIYAASEISGLIYMRSPAGSVIGAGLFLVLATFIGIFSFSVLTRETQCILPKQNEAKFNVNDIEIPPRFQELYQQLSAFIDDNGFTQPRLTLNRLAEQLGTQEHRLRSLINQCLGYRNFSSYLNDHRLPLACDWLRDRPELAITDVAFELGYGSITSFNRAFKATYGQAPSEYRNQ